MINLTTTCPKQEGFDITTLDYITQIELGELQHYKNASAVPLYHTAAETLAYRTLAEALQNGVIVVTEVNAGGSVPDLKVVNNADLPILLLDGEELKGAKQNRVLNASVLLDAHSETIIPVSCTEAGRWAYTSETFNESGYVMPRDLRANRSSPCPLPSIRPTSIALISVLFGAASNVWHRPQPSNRRHVQ